MAHKTKGAWNIMNLRGIMKTFKDPESDEARAWMVDRTEKAEKAPKVEKVSPSK